MFQCDHMTFEEMKISSIAVQCSDVVTWLLKNWTSHQYYNLVPGLKVNCGLSNSLMWIIYNRFEIKLEFISIFTILSLQLISVLFLQFFSSNFFNSSLSQIPLKLLALSISFKKNQTNSRIKVVWERNEGSADTDGGGGTCCECCPHRW